MLRMHIMISVIDITLNFWFGIWTLNESFAAIGSVADKGDPNYEPP